MLRVPIHKIEPGMVLARPIPMPEDSYRFLVQRDREVPPTMIPRLEQLGVLEVWVRYPKLEFLEDVIDEGVSERQREVYGHVRKNFESVMENTTAELDLTVFQNSISSLFDCIRQSRRGNTLLQKLDAFDNFLMSHSTNVCYLSMLLGMKVEQYVIEERNTKTAKEAKDLKDLGLGCLLHDVGKMRIPPEVLNKPGKLTDEEMEVMKMHPVFGYEMVKGRVPATASSVVLNHHQKYGGGGYPTRVDRQTGEDLPSVSGKQIPIFCRISTVCDVYDAATTTRVYRRAKPAVQVLHEMHTFCKPFFDPYLLKAFAEIVPAFPIGQIVELSDGSEAAVVDFNPRHPLRPKVQGLRDPLGEEIPDPSLAELDLAINKDLEIVAVNGVNVQPFTLVDTRDSNLTPAFA